MSAARARRHLFRLSALGIGKRTVADASRVAVSTIQMIRSGERAQIRAATERGILLVDRSCAADKTKVPAGLTWRRLRRLMAEGYPKSRIALMLGMKTPALQIGRERVTVRMAHRVARVYDMCILRGGIDNAHEERRRASSQP